MKHGVEFRGVSKRYGDRDATPLAVD
ncbi:MAG: hypothetical protein RLZZ126_686, partial [Pseudomonadota bacterium]